MSRGCRRSLPLLSHIKNSKQQQTLLFELLSPGWGGEYALHPLLVATLVGVSPHPFPFAQPTPLCFRAWSCAISSQAPSLEGHTSLSLSLHQQPHPTPALTVHWVLGLMLIEVGSVAMATLYVLDEVRVWHLCGCVTCRRPPLLSPGYPPAVPAWCPLQGWMPFTGHGPSKSASCVFSLGLQRFAQMFAK